MKGGQIDPPEKATLKKPSLIRIKVNDRHPGEALHKT